MPVGFEGPKIEISVEGWLTRIEEKADKGFARLEALLGNKADKSDISKLSTQIEGIDKRTTALERDRDERVASEHAHEKLTTSRQEWKRWAIPTSLSAIYTAVVLLSTHVIKL